MTLARVIVSGELYGLEKWANVFHVDKAGATDVQDIFDLFETIYATTTDGSYFLLYCAGTVATGKVGVHMSQISYQEVVDPGIPITRAVDHKGGQNTAGGLPVDVSLCISWQTARAGRSFRGRTYLPPWHENTNDDTTEAMPSPDSAKVTLIATAARRLLLDLQGLDSPLVVYSRKLGSAQEITAGYIDNEWDTQRRRSRNQPKTRHTFLGS